MSVILRDCPYCGAANSTLTCVAASAHPMRAFTYRALFVCNRCGNPFATNTYNSGSAQQDPTKYGHGDLEHHGFEIKELTPRTREPSAPKHTPQSISKRFIESEDSFRRGKWTSAVGMYRSTLDIATKEVAKVALPKPVDNLASRIDALASAHVITNAMKDWAHQVRGAGNNALHDEEEMKEEDAVQMRLFTQTFLTYAYELPGEVETRKRQKKAVP